MRYAALAHQTCLHKRCLLTWNIDKPGVIYSESCGTFNWLDSMNFHGIDIHIFWILNGELRFKNCWPVKVQLFWSLSDFWHSIILRTEVVLDQDFSLVVISFNAECTLGQPQICFKTGKFSKAERRTAIRESQSVHPETGLWCNIRGKNIRPLPMFSMSLV